MNSRKYIFPVIIFSMILFGACNKSIKESSKLVTSERSLPTFSDIKIEGNCDLYITKDSIQKVNILTDSEKLQMVETLVSNGILEIIIKPNKNINACRCDIYISCTSLKSLRFVGSGHVKSEGVFKGESFLLDLNGSGTASLGFEGKEIIASLNGSGNITVFGKVESARYIIEGSGKIRASGIESENTLASIKGSGNISLTSNNQLNAIINGSGNIVYNGSPKIIKTIYGSGTVVKN